MNNGDRFRTLSSIFKRCKLSWISLHLIYSLTFSNNLFYWRKIIHIPYTFAESTSCILLWVYYYLTFFCHCTFRLLFFVYDYYFYMSVDNTLTWNIEGYFVFGISCKCWSYRKTASFMVMNKIYQKMFLLISSIKSALLKILNSISVTVCLSVFKSRATTANFVS